MLLVVVLRLGAVARGADWRGAGVLTERLDELLLRLGATFRVVLLPELEGALLYRGVRVCCGVAIREGAVCRGVTLREGAVSRGAIERLVVALRVGAAGCRVVGAWVDAVREELDGAL